MGESIRQILARLQAARDATAVFGSVHTPEELQRAYHRLAKTCHPDLHPEDAQVAREAFIRLTRWHETAYVQLRNGTYGTRGEYGRRAAGAAPAIRLRHKARVYDVDPTVAFRGDFANVYRAVHDGDPVAVKVARQARDNDLLVGEHGLVLIGWTCAVEAGLRIRASCSAYEQWYPKEVMNKEPATLATDVAMGARCMLFLLPEDAPAALCRFFRGCMLPSPRQRPQDAWALLREFDELLARLWGPRRFHPFAVPAPCPR